MSERGVVTGIVIRQANFGDAHRILEVFSREHGRISAVARSARGSRRRFAGALDLFITLRGQVTPPKAGSSLWTLASAEVDTARLGIRTSLAAFERANLLCEAARLLFAEAQALPRAHDALAFGLDALDRGAVHEAAAAWVGMLAAAGVLREPPIGESAAVSACFRGAPCADDRTAARVEALCVAFVESEVGRPLTSRLTMR